MNGYYFFLKWHYYLIIFLIIINSLLSPLVAQTNTPVSQQKPHNANSGKSSESNNTQKNLQQNPWKLREGILAPLYQNVTNFQGKQATLRLRLQAFEESRRELIFYDDKGNPLIVYADILFYDQKILSDFRKLITGVYYNVRFEITGLDFRKRLAGRFIYIERDILGKL